MRPGSGATTTLLLAAALALAACDWMPGRPLEQDRPRNPREITDFATLYANNCAGCHGSEGELGPAREFASPLFQAFLPDPALRNVIREGVPGTGMPAFAKAAGGSLMDPQVEALVSGMRRRWARPSRVDASVLPPYSEADAVAAGYALGDPGRGREAFQRACAWCHGADGNGGEEGGSVVAAAFLGLVSDQMLRTVVVCGRPDLGMPDWREPPPELRLSVQEVSDVVSWLASHRPPDLEPARGASE